MTARKLVLTLGVALASAVLGHAQAMRTERHAFALAASQRLDLLDAWLAATPERRRAAAASAAKPNDGNPYLTLAEARAALAGSAAPAVPEILRASLAVFALPEVCDGERFPAVHVTLHAPRGLPVAIDGLAFDLELVDGAGEIVASATLGDAVGNDDLMRFRATAPLAFSSAAPGRCRPASGVRSRWRGAPLPETARASAGRRRATGELRARAWRAPRSRGSLAAGC